MRRQNVGSLGRRVAMLLLVCAAPALLADEADPLRKEVLALNTITGEEPMSVQLRTLTGDPAGTKRLVLTALSMTKEKTQPLRYNAALILAQATFDLKDIKASEAFYRICTEQAAKLQSTRKLQESYGGLIELFYEHKKYDESVRICRELLELKTDDGKPRIVLHAVTNRFGETDFDEDDRFDSAKRLAAGVHALLIQAMAKQGKYEKALEFVENLLKAQDHWKQRQLKGLVLREAGKFADAAKVYEDVLDRVAKDKDLEADEKAGYQERYRYILSNVYVDMKQIDQATEQLQKLLANKPDDPGYNNDLGYIWADNDVKLEEAEKLIRKALDLDRKRRAINPSLTQEEKERDNGAYLDSLGWVLFKQKKYKEAKSALLKAVEDKNSQHIEIYDHLGDVHLLLGERELAVQAWRKGLEVVGEGRREAERKAVVEKKLKKKVKSEK